MASLRTKNALTSAPPASAAQAIGSAPIVIPPTAVAPHSRAWAATSSPSAMKPAGQQDRALGVDEVLGGARRWSARPRRSRARARAARRAAARELSSECRESSASAHPSPRRVPIKRDVIHRALDDHRLDLLLRSWLASFALFALDQLAGASKHQQTEITPSVDGHADPARPSTTASRGSSSTTPPQTLTSPFSSIVQTDSQWVLSASCRR